MPHIFVTGNLKKSNLLIVMIAHFYLKKKSDGSKTSNLE